MLELASLHFTWHSTFRHGDYFLILLKKKKKGRKKSSNKNNIVLSVMFLVKCTLYSIKRGKAI